MTSSKNKYVLVESGLKGIHSLAARYNLAEIYFHQDL